MQKRKMKILVACEYSGIVRDAFIRKGHDAISCDILPTESPGPHYKGDVMDILYDDWDMVIAFPPCTDIAVSGSRSFAEKIADGRQEKAVQFFLKFTKLKCPQVVIENPIGIMSSRYRQPDQIVHPYYFGDPYEKSTCLWLKGVQPLVHWSEDNLFYPSTHVIPEVLFYRSKKTKSGYSRYSKFGKLGKGKGKERSAFPPGLSNAMADQWG